MRPRRATTIAFSCVLLMACALAHPSLAAFRLPNNYQGYFLGGVGKLDSGEIDGRLAGLGYPKFPEFMGTAGVGFTAGHRWFAGFEFLGLIGPERTIVLEPGRYSLWYSGFLGTMSVGRRIVDTDNIGVYPVVAFGYADLSIDLQPKEAVRFDQALVRPAGAINLSGGTGVIEAGLGAEYVFGKRSPKMKRIVVGVRGGHAFGFGHRTWSQGFVDVRDGPAGGIEGPFGRISLGFSYRD